LNLKAREAYTHTYTTSQRVRALCAPPIKERLAKIRKEKKTTAFTAHLLIFISFSLHHRENKGRKGAGISYKSDVTGHMVILKGEGA
jgi:hypothetical protein